MSFQIPNKHNYSTKWLITCPFKFLSDLKYPHLLETYWRRRNSVRAEPARVPPTIPTTPPTPNPPTMEVKNSEKKLFFKTRIYDLNMKTKIVTVDGFDSIV